MGFHNIPEWLTVLAWVSLALGGIWAGCQRLVWALFLLICFIDPRENKSKANVRYILQD